MLVELKKIGLSDNEAKVYLALLELGSATVQQIAKAAQVNRPTTYVQLESLVKNGLVTSFERAPKNKNLKPKTYFRVEDPEYLQKLVNRERNQIDERERELAAILPELGRLFVSAGERPRVRFFDGVEGLKTMDEEFLKVKNKLIEGITSLDDVLKVFPPGADNYTERRIKKGIRTRGIYTSSQGPILKNSDSSMLRETRYVPPDKFPFSCDITVYDNSVAIASLRDKIFGVVIESKEIANSIRSLISLAWDAAEKYN